MDAVYALADHPVYGSLRKVLGRFCALAGGEMLDNSHRSGENTHIVLGDNRLFFKRTEIPFSRKNLYVLNSPIVSLECWEALLRGCPAVLCEEYYQKGGAKDRGVGIALRPFRGYPFISQTKRTHKFLSKNGFDSLLLPPAIEKTRGSKKRGHFLFVGKMIESKNPGLVLELASRMKDEEFIMIGEGTLEGEVRAKAKSLGNVEVMSKVEKREELFSEYYPKAKALIHPTFKDPIGFVLVEALSCGAPVIASENVGASDYLPSEWKVRGYKIDEWVERLKGIGPESSKLAEEVFEKEMLDIESPYFERLGEKLYGIVKKKGWAD
ncbi:MAG: glycosyltransferase [Candidatus Micrarchaeota archaeon]